MKKHYVVRVNNSEDWEIIHQLLTKDGTLEDNIPSRSCECVDLQDDNDNRSTYLLEEKEVELLESHPKVKYVEIDINFHRDYIRDKNTKIEPAANRFSQSSKIYRQAQNDGTVSPPNSFTHGNAPGSYPSISSTEQYRSGYQISRILQKADPYSYDNASITEPIQTSSASSQSELYPQVYASWLVQQTIKKPSNVLSQTIQYSNDGTDIDVVICDDGVWLGHPEFVDSSGNSLVKDIIIDGPYYIDPDAFSPGNPHGHTTTTFMGRTVPTNASAVDWWTTSSKRSSQFQSIGTLTGLGSYSMTSINGSNSAYPNLYQGCATHGTSAASLAYGKTFGHAFNSNKWTILYPYRGASDPVSEVNLFKALKIWHQNKPTNGTYGTKNPTVINLSIQGIYEVYLDGYDSNTQNNSNWYWKWRSETGSFQTGDLSSFTNSTQVESALTTVPKFMRTSPYQTLGLPYTLMWNFNPSTVTVSGQTVYDTESELAALSNVFIFVCGGNQKQKIVKSDHPDYNNYVSRFSSPTEAQKIYTNRGGLYYDVIPSGFSESPVFSVGALDDNKILDGGLYKERIAFYSTRGNRVDFYSPADDTLAASGQPTVYAKSGPYFFPRYNGNAEYTGQSQPAYDSRFNGTSAASPVSAGYFATFLQTRRNWSALKLKSYIRNSIDVQSSSNFYYGSESTSANSSSQYDLFSLEGSDARVLYAAAVPSITITSQPSNQVLDPAKSTPQGSLPGNSATFSVTATQDTITGTLSYQWQRAQPSTPSTFVDISGATSSSYIITTNENNNVNGAIYRCKISGTNGVDDTYTNTATLTVRTYTLSSLGSANEGSNATFNVTTTNVSNGTTLYYTITGTNVTTADFSDNSLSGSFTINSNSGSFSKIISSDLTTEGSESFNIYIRTGSISGNAVESGSFIINDTSTAITPIPPGANVILSGLNISGVTIL